MPPSRTAVPSGSSSAGTFRKTAPFKPPGPASRSSDPHDRTTSSSTSSITGGGRRGPAAAAAAPPVPTTMTIRSSFSSDDDFGTALDLDDVDVADLVNTPPPRPPGAAAGTPRPDPAAAQPARHHRGTAGEDRDADAEDGVPGVPAALLTRVMHEAYRDKGTGISREANAVMRRYVDVFVREAVARAAEGQKEKRREGVEGGGAGDGEDVWLDVEDLERIVPGMVLDF